MRPLPRELLRLAAQQDGLFTRSQAAAAGLSLSTLDRRLGVTLGAVLPTVYATFTGSLTVPQRLRAAVLFGRLGGDETVAVLGGLAACNVHGLRAAAQPDVIQLLLPHGRRLTNHGFVVVRRTHRLGPVWRVSGLPVCSPARAVVDAARRMDHLDPVRELVAQCVQTSKATTEAIAAELRTGGSAGSLLTRRALAEVADGVRSVAEAKLYRLLVRRRFPAATWNPDLFDGSGSWLAAPDAIWPEAGLIVEVESREWHLSPESWAATMRRTNRLSRLGYAVQQLPPSRIVAEPEAVVAELRAAYAAGIVRTQAQGRPHVTIRVRGAA